MKTREKQTRLKKAFTVIILIIILFSIIYNLLYFISGVFGMNRGMFGISLFVVDNNSMKPQISKNDLAVIKKGELDNLKQNDIIIYFKNENYKIKRIMNINNENDRTSFVTKGDNNYYNDVEQILKEDVEGKVLFDIPKFGFIINMLRSKILTLIVAIYITYVFTYVKHLKKKKERRRREYNKIKENSL